MSRIRPATPFKSEDYPTQRAWIGAFFSSLNPFLTDVAAAITRGLTFTDNISSVTTTIEFSYTGTASDFPKKIAYGFTDAPAEVRVCSCLEGSTRRLALVNWTFNESVNVTDVVIYDGSTWRKPVAGTRYRLTLRAHP